MKNTLALSCFLLCSALNCPAQYYNWITGGGSDENMSIAYEFENVTNVCTDYNGNVYVTSLVGATNIRADTFFDALAHEASSSTPHLLLASYKCDGTMRWAKLIECDDQTFVGGPPFTYSNSGMACYKGGLYLSGAFEANIKYIGTDTTFNNNPLSFVLKYDTSGRFKWIRFIGPDSASTQTYTGQPGIISIDAQGFIHDFNSIKAGLHLMPGFTTDTTGNYDLKYDSSGNLLSAKRIHLDSTWTVSKAIFNTRSDKYYTVVLPNSSYYYTYHSSGNSGIAGFNQNGNLLWSDTSGANGTIYSLAFDGHNGLYLCGNGQDSFYLGGLRFVNTVFPPYYNSAMVMKLDTNGFGHWLYNLQSNLSVDRLNDITLVNNNKLAATGLLAGTSIHGMDTIMATSGEQTNPLFLIVDTSGRTLKLDQFHGPTNLEQGTAIAADRGSNIYVGGMLASTMTATGISTYSTNGGNTDFFLVKYGYSECDSLIPLPVASSPVGLNQNQINIFPNPATEELNVVGVSEQSTYQILDVTGKPWCSGLLQPGPNTISTKDLHPGSYLIEIMEKNGAKQIVRLVIE